VRVGTSGWHYDDWRGRFYPDGLPRSRWLGYYAERYATVELNASFYRLPRETAVTAWHDQAPEGFRFAVKGSRFITHNKKLRDPEPHVELVTTRMRGLGHHLGPWLWQLPPNLHVDVDRLERFLAALPAAAGHAVEFRHTSWFTSEVEHLLRRHGVAWVWLSDGQMPDVAPITSSFVYLRFHGLGTKVATRYRWDYTRAELDPWARRLRDAALAGCDGWVYFNNDYDARAPRNADVLIELLGDVAYPWPPAG
jgi:uncharacterized protein YecE (DUF72 family)